MDQPLFWPGMTVTRMASAGLGAAWSAFGVVQFSGQAFATPTMLMAGGMSQAQAALYASLPLWMTVAFGVGVFGGLVGSLLLLAGKRIAPTLLVISLVGYIALFVGDIIEGVFAAFGTSQIVILSAVVLIALMLVAVAFHARKTGQLR